MEKEEDKGDEEGDHGSIVAFRIPCRPSVDFQPHVLLPLSLWFTPTTTIQPAESHPLATRLLSCPPSLVPIVLSLFLSCLNPRYPSVALILRFSCRHSPPHHPMRLARNHQPSTAVAYLHRRRARIVTQAQTRRPDTRLSSLLPLAFPCATVVLPSLSFIPLLSSASFLCVDRALSFARKSHFRSGFLSFIFSLSHCLSASLSLVASPTAASEGEARATRSRSVA